MNIILLGFLFLLFLLIFSIFFIVCGSADFVSKQFHIKISNQSSYFIGDITQIGHRNFVSLEK